MWPFTSKKQQTGPSDQSVRLAEQWLEQCLLLTREQAESLPKFGTFNFCPKCGERITSTLYSRSKGMLSVDDEGVRILEPYACECLIRMCVCGFEGRERARDASSQPAEG